jgi:hypothetical protein
MMTPASSVVSPVTVLVAVMLTLSAAGTPEEQVKVAGPR